MFNKLKVGDKVELYLGDASKIRWTHSHIEGEVIYGKFTYDESTTEIDARLTVIKGVLTLNAE